MSPACDYDAAGEMAQAIGQDAAASLIEHFGGTSLYVPRKVADDHPICRSLGRQNADRVVAWAGGGTLPVPKGDNLHALHDSIVRARTEDGRTVAQIARGHNLSERQVYRILRKARSEAATTAAS